MDRRRQRSLLAGGRQPGVTRAGLGSRLRCALCGLRRRRGIRRGRRCGGGCLRLRCRCSMSVGRMDGGVRRRKAEQPCLAGLLIVVQRSDLQILERRCGPWSPSYIQTPSSLNSYPLPMLLRLPHNRLELHAQVQRMQFRVTPHGLPDSRLKRLHHAVDTEGAEFREGREGPEILLREERGVVRDLGVGLVRPEGEGDVEGEVLECCGEGGPEGCGEGECGVPSVSCQSLSYSFKSMVSGLTRKTAGSPSFVL